MRSTIFTLAIMITAGLFQGAWAQSSSLWGPSGQDNSTGTAVTRAYKPAAVCAKGEVIQSFNAPVTTTGDLAWDGEYLWLTNFSSSSNTLYKISPEDGQVVKTISTSIFGGDGLTFDGTDLWITDSDNQTISRIDTANGTVLSSFPASNPSGFTTGLAWDGTDVWYNDVNATWQSDPDSLNQISTTGVSISKREHLFPSSSFASGLAFDGQFLWSADNVADEIYQIDVVNNAYIDTIDVPGGSFPNGLAYDGQFMWIANFGIIYQIRIRDAVEDIIPASLQICQGDSVLLGGAFQTVAGVYRDTLTNAAGCDSTVETTLAVAPVSQATESVSVCKGESYTFPDGTMQMDITEDTAYTSMLMSAAGCDSTITTDITVSVVDTAVTVASDELTATATNSTFQWLNCDGNSVIDTATMQTYQPGVSGNYAVIVTGENGCVDTSACFSLTVTHLQTLNAESVRLYPNPVQQEATLTLPEAFSQATVRIFDLQGRELQAQTYVYQQEITLKMGAMTKGLYLCQIEAAGEYFSLMFERE